MVSSVSEFGMTVGQRRHNWSRRIPQCNTTSAVALRGMPLRLQPADKTVKQQGLTHPKYGIFSVVSCCSCLRARQSPVLSAANADASRCCKAVRLVSCGTLNVHLYSPLHPSSRCVSCVSSASKSRSTCASGSSLRTCNSNQANGHQQAARKRTHLCPAMCKRPCKQGRIYSKASVTQLLVDRCMQPQEALTILKG